MRRWLVAAGVVLLCAIGSAGATTLQNLEFADMTRQADRVVVGTVTALDGQWDATGRFIHTNVTLQVDENVQGDGPQEIVVRTPGGQVGGVAVRAEGAPSFSVGESVVVFLTRWEDGANKVLGYAQGKSRVVDSAGTLRLVGGVADGRSLDAVKSELQGGTGQNIPLRPAWEGGR